MKRHYLKAKCVALLLAVAFPYGLAEASVSLVSSGDDYFWIDIDGGEKIDKDKVDDRSLAVDPYALYWKISSELEVYCSDAGMANVTLYGPMGIPVDTYTFDSNSEPMVVLSVPSDSGTYRIVIDADKYSGEGEFEVR